MFLPVSSIFPFLLYDDEIDLNGHNIPNYRLLEPWRKFPQGEDSGQQYADRDEGNAIRLALDS